MLQYVEHLAAIQSENAELGLLRQTDISHQALFSALSTTQHCKRKPGFFICDETQTWIRRIGGPRPPTSLRLDEAQVQCSQICQCPAGGHYVPTGNRPPNVISHWCQPSPGLPLEANILALERRYRCPKSPGPTDHQPSGLSLIPNPTLAVFLCARQIGKQGWSCHLHDSAGPLRF